MASVNKVILLGNLGNEPELRYTPNGKAVANFSLATQETFGKGEEKKTTTEWHKIQAWGRLAEVCGEYLKKGSQVYLEGRLQTRSWDDKDGNKRYTTEIVIQTMQMLSKKQEGQAPRQDEPVQVVVEEDLPF